jgi:4-amino-4-deoxy-L-arabinose transferase-like glycosyltransferase
MDVNDRHLRLSMILCLIVAAGFAVRAAALAHYGAWAINSGGAEYARIAENLRNGVGYVGLATPGPEVNFPPLFPLLIAGTSFVTHNYEWAGRVVSLILGVLLPLPVFGIASRLFNRRVGFIAALLASLHPLLVNLSFAVLSEGPYATLLLSAVYIAIRALNDPSVKLWALAGGAFGLSYLLRAEASGTFAIAVLFALTATKGEAVVKCKRAVTAILVFVVLALPEVIFIYKSTGKVRLEVKSAIFFYTARRILAAETTPGMSYKSPAGGHEEASSEPNVDSWLRWEEKWATYGIDSRLNGTGITMRSFAASVREVQITRKDLFLLVKGIGRNAPVLLRRFSSDWLGAPLLPALAVLGALRRPWRGPQASSRLFFMLIAAVPLVANAFALVADEPRYSFIFVPLLSIWAANGLFEVGQWTKASAAADRMEGIGSPDGISVYHSRPDRLDHHHQPS